MPGEVFLENEPKSAFSARTFFSFLLFGVAMHPSTQECDKFAIIGIGCRMPPSAVSLETFWKFLLRGGNALRPVRKDRWDVRQYFDEDPRRPGKTYAPKFAMLESDIKLFDPLVFGISPREAACMDPQQRLLLEVTWEALEDAGIPREKVAGTLTGVFIGGFCLDHFLHQMQPANRHLLQAHSPVGASMTLLSNRLSHAFDFRGPSLTMDTACSSSLVAIHFACQSLKLRESDMVVAGGVNSMARPDFPILMSKGHFLSDHGECHAFDVTAAGYARGEGAGVFLIKRLEDALAQRDSIHAVIRGSGVNQDGHTDGISLPNSEAQEMLVREIYAKAGLIPGEVDYIEAHGTGTQAGDPAETRALDAVFSKGRTKKLPVGSVKTNIGHLEAAAGVAGMLKAIGVLKNRQIPRNLHFSNPNPKIPFEDYCLQIVQETTTLPAEEEKPVVYAAVNSFGYGGTNAHVILESAPPLELRPVAASLSRPFLVPLSAGSEKALRDLTAKFAFVAGQEDCGSIADLAYTTAFRRTHALSRCVAIAEDMATLRGQWIAASTGQPHEGLVMGTAAGVMKTGPVFVYTGMGPQWWGMGQELIQSEPVFAEAIDEVDRHFQTLAGWSLKEAMLAGEKESRMERTELAQPANFAIQVALTRLWESFGIRPSAVIGHSVGEVSAAYVAGVYSMEDAIRVSFHRSRLQQTMAGRGAMLAVGLPEAEALKRIANFSGVSIAAVNSFHAVTLSGDADELREIAAALEKEEIFQKFLRVEVAYHSPQMDPLREELFESLAGVSPGTERIPLYSTAFGKRISAGEWGPEYWWRNVRQPVHFAAAMRELFEEGFTQFLEIGPHPVLGNSIKECAAHLEKQVACFTSLRRKESEVRRILLTAGELYCAGFDLNWEALAPVSGRFLSTPKYPWQRELHWVESERSKMERLGLPGPVYLNRTLPGGSPCWEVEVNRQYFPFLMDHGVQDQTVFPGMGYMEAALCLGQRVHETEALVLENVSFERVLIVDYSKLHYLLTTFDAEDGRFSIFSRVEGEEDSIQRQARGRMIPLAGSPEEKLDLESLAEECSENVAPGDFYERLARRGLHYGEEFQKNTEVFTGKGCFFVKISEPGEEGHLLHPTVTDAAIQPILYCAEGETLFVPFSIGSFEFFSTPAAGCFAFGRLTSQSGFQITADVWILDPEGKVCVRMRHILLQAVELSEKSRGEGLFFHPVWKLSPLEGDGGVPEGAEVLVLADADTSDRDLVQAVLDQLPGSTLETVPHVPGEEGFGKATVADILARHATEGRNRLVVLWGSASCAREVVPEQILAANEKVIGLLQAAGELSASAIDITFVTRNAKPVMPDDTVQNLKAASFDALGLVAQNEYENLMCRSVDLPGTVDPKAAATWIVTELASASRGTVAFRGKERWDWSIVPKKDEGTKEFFRVGLDSPVELRPGAKGRADSLVWESCERVIPGEGEIEIRVHAAAVNYKDVLKAEGRIHPIALEATFWGHDLGMECAGTVVAVGSGTSFVPGDRVAAILPAGFRSYATVAGVRAVKIPERLGMEAAAVPVVYLTAYRGLVQIACLRKGERVLVHNATGGLGLAAMEIAKWVGAEIFATAGSEEKQEFLRQKGIRHVFSSRTLDFGRLIREVTGDEGVDVVIGAPTGLSAHVSLGLLRSGGRYIEVGKKDIAEDNSLPLRPFNRNLVFASLDIDRLAAERPDIIQETLRKIFGHFEAGDFQLGPVTFYEAEKIREAFELMARSRHIGKLLVDLSRGEVETLRREEPRPVVRSDGCYVVTGGTSGFGLATAGWLASSGAGKVILISRSGKKAPGIEETVRQMEQHGTEVDIRSLDVTEPEALRTLLKETGDSRFPLRGVVHAAMVLDDAMMANVTVESFRRVFQPKASGALHLASALEGVAGLDFVVFYSSISALVGNSGQTAYVAANAFLDGLAHVLRRRGIPAISINWGALSESGVVARDERLSSGLASAGIAGLGDREALVALKKVLQSSTAQVGVFSVDWRNWHAAHPKLSEDPRFQHLNSGQLEGGGDAVLAEFRKSLAGLSKEQRLRVLEDQLQEVLASTLKMSKESVSPAKKLNEIGVDSLMVLELSLGIKEKIGILFSAMEFLKGPTLRQLAALAEKKL